MLAQVNHLTSHVIASEKVPQALIDQLAVNGKLVLPVGHDGNQQIVMITKDASGKVT